MRPLVFVLALLSACSSPQPAQDARPAEPAAVSETAAESEAAFKAPNAGSSAGSKPAAAVLRGRFLLGGRPPASWSAGLCWSVAPVPLDAEGRFVLVSRGAGRLKLDLRPDPDDPDLPRWFTADLELVPGEQEWSCDVPVGQLTGRVAREQLFWFDWLQVSWRSGGLTFLATFNPAEDGAYAFDLVPAGQVELQLFDGWFVRPLAEVQVHAGETTRRDLP